MDKNLPDIAKLTIFSYYANGNRKTLTYSQADIVTTYTYNLANLVTNLTNKKGTSTQSSFLYTYYLDGNQATKEESTGRSRERNISYLCDDLCRLTEEKQVRSGVTLTKAYAYDLAGNRATMMVSGTESYTTEYDYDSNNRLKTETKDNLLTKEVAEYQYDKNVTGKLK